MSKRQRAMISQEESYFNTQARDADNDLVGEEQVDLGSDRNTVGIKTKQSPMPKSIGAYRGTALNTSQMLNRWIKSLCPKFKFRLYDNDLDLKQDVIGGYQLVWDAFNYLTRSNTTGYLGDDSFTSATSVSQQIIGLKTLRNVYKQIVDRQGTATHTNAIVIESKTETGLPSLNLTGFTTTKTYTNVGNNTIVVELWDMLCTEDTNMSPLTCWSKDMTTYDGPAGTRNVAVNPQSSKARKTWGDPGCRPDLSRDRTIKDHWRCLRKTRYIIRGGQSVHHVVTLPSTSIGHDQLWAPNNVGDAIEVHTFKRNISIMCLGFALGEICIDGSVNSQKIGSSSVFLQGRATWDFTAQIVTVARANINIIQNYEMDADFVDKSVVYPQITVANQRLIASAAPVSTVVKDFDAATL